MDWMGKLVGGAAGFVMGGPVGAIAGAVFGHMFDGKDQGRPFASAGEEMTPEERARMTFFIAAFSMLGKLVKADGHISESETASVRRFMTDDLGLSQRSRQVAEQIFHAAAKAPQNFDDFAKQFYAQFYAQPQLIEMMIDILLRVSVADGKMTPAEEHLILSAVRIFRMPPDTFDRLRVANIDLSEQYYAALGCKPGDSDARIREQYRRKVREFHPDTITAKGLPEEFIRFAHDRFREIQNAYDMIRKGKNK